MCSYCGLETHLTNVGSGLCRSCELTLTNIVRAIDQKIAAWDKQYAEIKKAADMYDAVASAWARSLTRTLNLDTQMFTGHPGAYLNAHLDKILASDEAAMLLTQLNGFLNLTAGTLAGQVA
jgi:hypothetical protein